VNVNGFADAVMDCIDQDQLNGDLPAHVTSWAEAMEYVYVDEYLHTERVPKSMHDAVRNEVGLRLAEQVEQRARLVNGQPEEPSE
jgi:hypothetical protein